MNVALIVLAIISSTLIFRIFVDVQKKKILQENLNRYRQKYLSKSGATSLYFPPGWTKTRENGDCFTYYLMSFDGGINWYAIDRDKLFNEIVVLGLVDHVYPGFMKHLKGMDTLTNHVTKNGPIDLSKQEDIDVLTDAGFSINKIK